MDDERSTKFHGVAQLLLAELTNTDGWHLATVEKLVAQRLYDFAYHVTDHVRGAVSRNPEFVIKQYVPDLEQWPEKG